MVGAIEFDADVSDAFTGVVDAVLVEVDEDEVAEADGVLEAEVDGEVNGGVEVVIAAGVDAGFTIGTGGGVAWEESDEAAGDTGEGGVGGVDTVFADVIITGEAFGDADGAEERLAAVKLGAGDVGAVVAGGDEVEEIEAASLGEGGLDWSIEAGGLVFAIEFDENA